MTEEEKSKLLIEIAKLLELINGDIISYRVKRILPTGLMEQITNRINVFLSHLSSVEDSEVLEDFANLFYDIHRTINQLRMEISEKDKKNFALYEGGFPKDQKDKMLEEKR